MMIKINIYNIKKVTITGVTEYNYRVFSENESLNYIISKAHLKGRVCDIAIRKSYPIGSVMEFQNYYVLCVKISL